MPTSIYKSAAGEAELQRLYDAQLARLDIPYESRIVKTRFGDTHVLVTGDPSAPPLVVLHGAYDSAPSNLKLFIPLTEQYRVYAVDTIGQSVRSAPVRLSPGGNSYGLWLVDVLDSLALQRVPFVSVSFGAGIFLRLVVCASNRVSQAALVVPSGIANGPISRMTRELFIPWMLYFLSPSQKRLMNAVRPMMTEEDDEFVEFVGAFLRNVNWKPEGPKLTSKQELAGYFAPTLLFVTDDDVFFPGDKVEARAKEIIPCVAGIEHLHGKHLPSRRSMQFVNRRILEFLRTAT